MQHFTDASGLQTIKRRKMWKKKKVQVGSTIFHCLFAGFSESHETWCLNKLYKNYIFDNIFLIQNLND